jgi:hypothetical protein
MMAGRRLQDTSRQVACMQPDSATVSKKKHVKCEIEGFGQCFQNAGNRFIRTFHARRTPNGEIATRQSDAGYATTFAQTLHEKNR